MYDEDVASIAAMRAHLEFMPVPERIYTPDQAKATLNEAGMSYETAARILNVSGRTVASWVADEHRPNPQIEAYWFKLLSALQHYNSLRDNRLAAGVSRLLEMVRSTPAPVYEEVA